MVIMNFSDIDKQIDKLEKIDTKNVLGWALKKACHHSIKYIRPITPVVTGRLKSKWKVSQIDYNPDKVTVKIYNRARDNKTNVYYASLVNDGFYLKSGKWWEGRHILERGIEKAEVDNYIQDYVEKELERQL